ncbi:facilitated trehalose transporter Tret1-like [Coccinella septempunctata]|uniref:facilitated trehalose transporter Tret1-like n=1 Tax=Coccinella septempunctata TaxID=41139 RepID=UPI001D0707EB|nr:facilitated trehalose transporter Tret1-like [Coccinella septempunctata]
MLNEVNLKLIVAVCTVNVLNFATGNVYAWSSSVLIALKKTDPKENPLGHIVTPLEESLIASILSLGAICGPMFAGFCSNLLGRKTTLMLFAIPMLLSNVILMFATTTLELYVARFMAGFASGSFYTVVPIYVGEIAETKIRGVLGGFMSIFYVFGLLFNYVVGPCVSLPTLSAFMIVPIVIFLIFFGLFIPESPYYYFAKGKDAHARRSLMKLRNHFEEKELAIIEETINESRTNVTLSSLLRNASFKKGLTLTATIVILQQLVGITAILAYMEDIFIASGSTISSSTSTIVVAIIQVISVVFSTCLSDKLGRKILLVISNLLCAAALFPLGVYFWLKQNENDVSHLGYLPIACVILFITGYNFGLCTIPWTLVGELFSNETKAIASSATATSCYIMAFSMSFLFPHLLNWVGFHGVFWFCGCMGIVNLTFVAWYLPETKGKSFSEILKLLEGEKLNKETYETVRVL